MKRIVLTSSSGGHFEQLNLIYKNLMNNNGEYLIFVITEETKYTKKEPNFLYIKQINRKSFTFPFFLAYNHFKIKKFIKKIKPDILISTGALCTISACLYAHKLKIKLIFIESYAKTSTPTKTGKLIYKYADYFIVQWPEMLKIYPNALYFGGIY